MSKFVPNSFMIANAFVDDAMNKLSDASVKIYLLIVRKTRGWTKESDALSLRQLEKLSKKSRPTVSKCLSELEEVGLIKKHHQSEALFWGFEIEELKDQSEIQSKRSAVVAGAEERMRLAKEKMATDKKAAFARKLAMIEAGDPEDNEE